MPCQPGLPASRFSHERNKFYFVLANYVRSLLLADKPNFSWYTGNYFWLLFHLSLHLMINPFDSTSFTCPTFALSLCYFHLNSYHQNFLPGLLCQPFFYLVFLPFGFVLSNPSFWPVTQISFLMKKLNVCITQISVTNTYTKNGDKCSYHQ